MGAARRHSYRIRERKKTAILGEIRRWISLKTEFAAVIRISSSRNLVIVAHIHTALQHREGEKHSFIFSRARAFNSRRIFLPCSLVSLFACLSCASLEYLRGSDTRATNLPPPLALAGKGVITLLWSHSSVS
jgi:hypothetical protein